MIQNEFNGLFDLSHKTIVLTGGTGVLGREIARALYLCGANVAIIARHPERARELTLLNERTIAVRADVLQIDSLQNAAQEISGKFGGVFGLINAAGRIDPYNPACAPAPAVSARPSMHGMMSTGTSCM